MGTDIVLQLFCVAIFSLVGFSLDLLSFYCPDCTCLVMLFSFLCSKFLDSLNCFADQLALNSLKHRIRHKENKNKILTCESITPLANKYYRRLIVTIGMCRIAIFFFIEQFELDVTPAKFRKTKKTKKNKNKNK